MMKRASSFGVLAFAAALLAPVAATAQTAEAREAWAAPRRVNPGAHAVVAARGGREARAQVSLADGENRSIVLDTRGLRAAAPSSVPAGIARGEPRPLGALFWIGAGIAATGI